jgi:hypothetical protein
MATHVFGYAFIHRRLAHPADDLSDPAFINGVLDPHTLVIGLAAQLVHQRTLVDRSAMFARDVPNLLGAAPYGVNRTTGRRTDLHEPPADWVEVDCDFAQVHVASEPTEVPACVTVRWRFNKRSAMPVRAHGAGKLRVLLEYGFDGDAGRGEQLAHAADVDVGIDKLRGQAIDVPGPENLTMTEVAQLLGARKVRHVPRGALRLLA